MNNIIRRQTHEKIFQMLGILSLCIACLMLVIMLTSIFTKASRAVFSSYISLDIKYQDNESSQMMMRKAIINKIKPKKKRDRRKAYALFSSSGWKDIDAYLRDNATPQNGQVIKVWVLADDEADRYLRDESIADIPENERRLSDQQIGWLKIMKNNHSVDYRFNTTLLTNPDSRHPEQAGLLGGLVGSLLTMLITLAISFPIGVLTATYLEEFANKNKFADLIEININNLAGVPSIIYGLLGLAVFLNFFGLPRSAPLVGGMVLSLMTIPIIVIAARTALRSIPPSIRQAALAMGASPLQTTIHHTLPYAMPGILTGVIVGMSRALGETAPLLMIGMAAFIADVPSSFDDAASALPVQIFLWADSPQSAFEYRTSAAIAILLCFLLMMNATAIWLRQKFEKQW